LTLLFVTVAVTLTVVGCHWLYSFSQPAEDVSPPETDHLTEQVPVTEASLDGIFETDTSGETNGCAESCDDGISCTVDGCTEEGWCMYMIEPGFCLIDKTCIPEGTNRPQNPLCEICNTTVSRTAWAPDNSVLCDDGNLCTYKDKCSAGTCKGASYSCTSSNAALSCVQDLCTGEGPAPWGCALDPGSCLIDKLCRAAGEVSIDDPCRLCEPATSAYSWSPAKACVTTLAGSGSATVSDHFGELASFSDPWGLALDTSTTPATLYATEATGHVVRRIVAGRVSILAGCS
jgi:hypothetical protein